MIRSSHFSIHSYGAALLDKGSTDKRVNIIKIYFVNIIKKLHCQHYQKVTLSALSKITKNTVYSPAARRLSLHYGRDSEKKTLSKETLSKKYYLRKTLSKSYIGQSIRQLLGDCL